MNSAYVACTQVRQFALQVRCWAPKFHNTLNRPPTLPLNPINPDNAWTFRITAAAGTELAGPYSYGTCKQSHVIDFIPIQKQFTTHRAVILHATWLVQTSVHWPIFLTAASRRSLDRVSVPMWGTFLSEPLLIVALVGRYPHQQANQTHPHPPPMNLWSTSDAICGQHRVLGRLSTGYPRVEGRLDTRYSPVRRSTSRMCKHIMPFPLDLHVLSL